MRVLFYQTSAGVSPVEKHLNGLPLEERATIAEALMAIEKNGIGEVDTRPIDGKLWEIRFPMQRIFYVLVAGPTLVLLHAYKKQSQKAPRREIELALKRMRDVLAYGG
ncbi:MAG: type II toxin-antitoxin system RelE/ParE family toxin [Deltaproteobacteria bacterium]|nr:type II toxin-antitoxin system RelE/ParE family toxin [Deltaproteobacteria bacterium]